MKLILATAALAAFAALAQEAEHRELGAHEHGVGHLDLAFEGREIAVELHVPGADIVGFEHAPESAEDRAAVDQAVAVLAAPLKLFGLPEDAGCSVTEASARLVGEEAHEGEAHAEAHADGHAEEHGAHSEFQAQYLLACADLGAISRIDFGYFATFPNARELEIQMVTGTGAQQFEVRREAPVLDLDGLI